MLTEEQKKLLMDWVNEQDIDASELPSYHYDKDPYGVGRELREWTERAIEEAVEKLEADGWDAYFDYDEDTQDPDELTKEAIEYLRAN